MKFNRRKDANERMGMKVNKGKTKVKVSGEGKKKSVVWIHVIRW